MTDRELLEQAAKAAGYKREIHPLDPEPHRPAYWIGWNPLTDDGDALRLAVKLNLLKFVECAQYGRAMAEVRYGAARGEYWEPVGDDPYAATRRAIVRAAAEIGKDMK